MNRRAVLAVVRRDLTVAAGSKAVVMPALIIPLLLMVLLPLLAGLLPAASDSVRPGDLDALLGALPAAVAAGLPQDPGQALGYVMVTHLLAPMVLLVPVLFASVLAADGVAGERERGTLEGLLLTPLTDRELAAAKLLSALLPAIAIGVVGAGVYATVGNLTVGRELGRLVLPTTEFTLLALWVGPAFAAVALGAVSLVSVRVDTTQEAVQLGGLVVLPVLGMIVSQALGALLLSPWVLLLAGVGGWALALVVLVGATRGMSRDRLGPRLG